MIQVNKIYNTNCLNFIYDLDNVENFKGDIYIMSDPPYNQKYHYDNYKDNLKLDEYKNLLRAIFINRKSVIIHYPEETINILATLGLGKLEQVVSWVYPSNTAKQHRLITWWNCNPDMKAVGQDYKNPTDKRIKERIARGEKARLYDWWEINQVKNVSKNGNNDHSCPIPYEVAERMVLLTTKPGDLVIDPFCGSGTICLAAKNNGRKYIGIELSKKYCEIAKNKLK